MAISDVLYEARTTILETYEEQMNQMKVKDPDLWEGIDRLLSDMDEIQTILDISPSKENQEVLEEKMNNLALKNFKSTW